MERTTAQNGTFLFAHNRLSKRRATFFRRLRAVASRQAPDIRRQMTLGESFILQPRHQDNGR